ncbi:MAG: patatin-like phospholipase family protein [Synergistaceae bacterium]|nr:patatin-like phospholipase family protein [Synergistaceae bacterium]
MLLSAQAFGMSAEETEKGRKHNEDWGFPHRDGIVLVLSGGGTKGLAHVGVFEVLEREKIPIAAIVGTSMGAIMGGLYAAGYNAAEMKAILSDTDLMEIISDRSNTTLADPGHNQPPSSGSSILSVQMDKNKNLRSRRGILKAKDLYAFLSELTSRVTVTDFNNLPIPFAAIATNLENGDTVVMRDGNLASALRASLSIPGMFDPWELNGKLLVDGGLKANLPVFEAKKIFPGHPIVAINLTPDDITRPRERLRSILEITSQTLDILMIDQIRANAASADLVISPKVSDFGILVSSGYDKIIARGTEATEPYIGALHELVREHKKDYARAVHRIPQPEKPPTIVEIRFEGVPEGIAEELHEKYDKWIGQPLDMAMIADAVKKLSARNEFSSIDGRTARVSNDTVAVIFSIERPLKYEFGADGYAGNIHPDRWLSLSAQIRDIFMDGDISSLEYRLGTKWGIMGRYFTPMDENDTQFGVILAGREEGAEPGNAHSFDFERYTGRITWYKALKEKMRIGLGYGAERVTSFSGDTESGPYISFGFNTLDDPIIPTKGISLNSDLWFPIGETAVTHTVFQTHLPIWENWKVILSGGLKTGNMDDPAYAVLLGSNEELYSLAKHPLVGDQAYWLHLGAARMAMRSWWGGVNVEFFGNYGQVMRAWEDDGSWWETGISLSVPMNNFGGKVLVVYDQGGEFTFGYSIGIPKWWDGPMP